MIEVQVSTPQTVNVDLPGKVAVTALPAAEVAYAKDLVSQAREASKTAQEAREAAESAQSAAEAAKEAVDQAVVGELSHSKLLGRDEPEQHPIKSIEGLEAKLLRIPAPTEALTNEELEELLK